MAILPIDTVAPAPGAPPPAWMLKSANRLTLMMGAGLPVVSNVIPAYEEVLQHGVNGLFAAGRQQWLACLERLRDPALRRSMGERARAAVLHDYSDQAQAASLLAALAHLQGDGGVAERACHSLPAG
jgi:glycosyltransferase involved in cell wall biosynthesis